MYTRRGRHTLGTAPRLRRGLRKHELRCPLSLLAMGRTIPLSALLELLRKRGDLKEKACWHSWSSSWTSVVFVDSFLAQVHQRSRLLLFEEEFPSMSLALVWKHLFFTRSLKKCICNEIFGVQELCVVTGLNLCWIPSGLFLSHDLRAIWDVAQHLTVLMQRNGSNTVFQVKNLDKMLDRQHLTA